MNEKAKATHTPGPWAVELPYNEPGVYVTQANPRMSNALICRMMDQAQAPEGRANAALIAAAPELLEALRYALKIDEVARRYFPKSIRNSDRFMLENNRASINKAIAKAEGAI